MESYQTTVGIRKKQKEYRITPKAERRRNENRPKKPTLNAPNFWWPLA